MSESFAKIAQQLDSLYGLPGAAFTLLMCFGIGYMFKLFEQFPNKYIPIPVVLFGIAFNILLRPPPPEGVELWQHYTRLGMAGFLIGLASCILYDKLISRIEDKLSNWVTSAFGADKPKDP